MGDKEFYVVFEDNLWQAYAFNASRGTNTPERSGVWARGIVCEMQGRRLTWG